MSQYPFVGVVTDGTGAEALLLEDKGRVEVVVVSEVGGAEVEVAHACFGIMLQQSVKQQVEGTCLLAFFVCRDILRLDGMAADIDDGAAQHADSVADGKEAQPVGEA